MKKLSLFGLLLCSMTGKAQFLDLTKLSAPLQQPTYLIEITNGNYKYLTYYAIATTEETSSIKISQTPSLTNRYGEQAKRGVIQQTFKPGTRILTLSQILKAYHIPKKDRHLAVFVDSLKVEAAQSLLGTKQSIASVQICTSAKRKVNVININTVYGLKGYVPYGGEKL